MTNGNDYEYIDATYGMTAIYDRASDYAHDLGVEVPDLLNLCSNPECDDCIDEMKSLVGARVEKMDAIEIKNVEMMGLELVQWRYKSCVANFGIGDDWATLYDIRSDEQGKGHATHILTNAKKTYEDQGKRFGGSIALNERMRSIYQRLGITEYNRDE